MSSAPLVYPFPQQAAEPQTRRVFVRDLVLRGLIGVHRHERDGAQRLRINLDLDVLDAPFEDRISDVPNYETLVEDVRRLVGSGHVNLVETLAERIAALCLADTRVLAAQVRVEKLDVFADAGGVGVEIHRRRGRDKP